MKVDQRNLVMTADGAEGSVKFTLQDEDDVWLLVSILNIGDHLRAQTTRKVAVGNAGTEMDRKRLTLTVKVTKIDFEFGAISSVRVSGTNQTESEWIMMGQFHTHSVGMGDEVVLSKASWDAQHLAAVTAMQSHSAPGDVAVVMMQEGIANVMIVGSVRTVLVAKVTKQIAKKRRLARTSKVSKAGGGENEKSVQSFFESTLKALTSATRVGPPRNEEDKRSLVRAVVLASPGYWKDDFHKFIIAQGAGKSSDPDVKALLENKAAFVLTPVTAAWRHNVLEVLSAPNVRERIADSRASHHIDVLAKFREMLAMDIDRAIYGPREVAAAAERGLIDELLLCDSLLRVGQTSDLVRRKQYTALCSSVEDSGGRVHVFSALHASGSELAKFGGVGALIRMPAPDLARGLEVTEAEAAEAEEEVMEATNADGSQAEWAPPTAKVPRLTVEYMQALLAS